MSRLANKAKAGFFPTPEEIVEIVATHIAPAYHDAYRALAPCAGARPRLAV